MKAVDPFQDDKPTGLAPGRGGFMANSQGTRYITDPSGATVKSGARKGEAKRLPYSDTSNFGKMIESSMQLTKWSERKVVEGLAEGGFDMLFDAYNAADPDERPFIADQIVARAKEVANASLAADRGTHVHALTEHFDRRESYKHLIAAGEALGVTEAQQVAVVTAWHKMLEGHGLEVVAIEASVVDDEWRCAGTLDRLVRCTRELRFVLPAGEIVVIPAGTVVVLDIKSGSLRKTAAIQCASYAHSVPYDTATEVRGEWAFDVDHEHALIAHIAIDAGTCELVYVDLVAGRDHGGQCVVMAKAWEARKDLFSVALLGDDPTSSVAPPAAIEDPSVPGVAPASPPPARTPSDELAAARERPTPEEGIDVDDITGDVLKARYDALAPAGRAWIADLVKDAIGAGVSFHMSTTKTLRRFHILRALVLMAENGEGDDDVRALLEPIIGDVAQFPSVPVGHLVGSLSVQEAATFVGLVDGTQILAVDDDGKARPQLAA